MLKAIAKPKHVSDAELATALAKLWPHREHEAKAVMGLACLFGWHRWRRLALDQLVPGKEVQYCFWCSKMRIDGVVYAP